MKSSSQNISNKPSWLHVRAPSGKNYQKINQLVSKNRLNTVCSSAACPNMGHCWQQKIATFMIMGNECTRACRFCNIKTTRYPMPLDPEEPDKLANSIQIMRLSHVVITSVTRDDLSDYGAKHFAKCINAIREKCPNSTIEVLTPDFLGNKECIDTVLATNPNVFNHNIETTRKLTPKIRSKSDYDRSLQILKYAKDSHLNLKTKSGLMVGLGETLAEIKESLIDLKNHLVDLITIGQYLRPSPKHAEIVRFIPPAEFAELSTFAYELGFSHVESAPLVRSSFHAEKAII